MDANQLKNLVEEMLNSTFIERIQLNEASIIVTYVDEHYLNQVKTLSMLDILLHLLERVRNLEAQMVEYEL